MLAWALGLTVPLGYFAAASTMIYFVSKTPVCQDILGGEAASVIVYGLVGVPAKQASSLALTFQGRQILNVVPGWWLMSQTSGMVHGPPAEERHDAVGGKIS
jgi:hypothetical protein